MTLLKRYKNLIHFCLFLLIGFSESVNAQGNLQIMPRRVVFDGTKRFQELNLANTGTDTAQYVVSLTNYKMTESGDFQEITTAEAGQNFADKYLRIFPRTVTLAPNESQTIKIQTIKASNMVTGEYRSHLYFRAVPRATPLGEKDSKSDSTKGLSIKLIPVFGISIPAIVRVGETQVSVSISDAILNKINEVPTLKLTFNRSGNISAYGNLIVKHVSPDGTVTQVGIAKGLAIYTPNPKRIFTLPLAQNKDIDYHKGKLQISFTTPDDTKVSDIAASILALK